MKIDEPISRIFEMVNEKKGDKVKFNQDKYVLLTAQNPMVSSRAKDAMTKELENRFGGYNAFGVDERLIDPKTQVRNLKSNVIEIRPKIFTDKPTEKQLDMTFETKMQVMNSSAIRKISTISETINTFTSSTDTRGQKAQSYMINKSILDSDGDIYLDKQRSSELRRNKEEGDFLYGHVSGNSLEQFVVTKINKKGKENLRLLCIDGSDIQHKEYTVKDKSKGG
jgi:hypothetical protein